MKKIIFAVASVLALGLFASCQREISGDLTVTETATTFDANDTLKEFANFDVTGTVTSTKKVTTKVGTADATWTKRERTETPHGKWERRIQKKRVSGDDNRTFITFIGQYNRKEVNSQSGTTATTTTVSENWASSHDNYQAYIGIEKIDGVYYLNGKKADVQPEGDTVTISCTFTSTDTETTGSGATSTLVETVVTTERTTVYALKFTKR